MEEVEKIVKISYKFLVCSVCHNINNAQNDRSVVK